MEVVLMPVRKRIHTTISEGFPAHNNKLSQTRRLITDAEGVEVELALFSYVDGRPQKRAALSEVECLLAGL